MIEFALRRPDFADIKVSRGLSAWSEVGGYDLAAALGLQPVTAGKANKLTVKLTGTTTALPPNANVKNVKAQINVGDADQDKTAAPASVGVSVTKNGKSDDPASGNFQVAVTRPPRPSNVKLSLEGGDAFWTNGGVLTEGSYDLPGPAFTTALNTYLDKLQPKKDPIAELTFVLQTDTPGAAGIKIESLTFSLIKTQSWSNPLDRTTRVDRTLTVDYGSILMLDLDSLAESNRQVALESIALDLAGQCKPDRLLGPIPLHDGHQFAIVDADRTVAQRLQLSGQHVKGTRRCTAISVLLSGAAPAELYLELQADAANYPAVGAPLARSNVKFKPPDKVESYPAWTVAQLSAPTELKPDTPYWIVIKGVSAGANVALGPQPSGAGVVAPVKWDTMYGSRGGQVWTSLFRKDPSPQIAALFGVIYLPGSDDQTAAIEINADGSAEAGDAATIAVDIHSAAQTVQLPITAAVDANAATLAIRSHAQGSVQIANVIRTYTLKA